MKNKRGKLITVLFVAAMSVSLFTGCSDDATITGLDEGALPELASDTTPCKKTNRHCSNKKYCNQFASFVFHVSH